MLEEQIVRLKVATHFIGPNCNGDAEAMDRNKIVKKGTYSSDGAPCKWHLYRAHMDERVGRLYLYRAARDTERACVTWSNPDETSIR